MHLTNLEELLQSVRHPSAKSYFQEAIISYQSGAYRSALIATWIAVCIDIVEKIKDLSIDGDQNATRLTNQIDSLSLNDVAGLLNFERTILDKACDELELISPIDKLQLSRLKEDRNLCAHPSFSLDGTDFNPTAELALSYIVLAANALLINPSVKGKYVSDRVFRLLNEDSFPIDTDQAYKVLSSPNQLGKVKDSAIRNLIIIILKRLFKDDEKLTQEQTKRFAAALGAISKLKNQIYNETLRQKLQELLASAVEVNLKRLIPTITVHNNLWAFVDVGNKTRIEAIIQSMDVGQLQKYKVLDASEVCKDIYLKAKFLISTFEPKDLEILFAYRITPLFIDEAIKLFLESRSFDQSENRGINIILKVAGKLTSEQLEAILKGSVDQAVIKGGYNQILHAGFCDAFLTELCEKTKNLNSRNGLIWDEFIDNTKSFNFQLYLNRTSNDDQSSDRGQNDDGIEKV
jgi:hypothetical protein